MQTSTADIGWDPATKTVYVPTFFKNTDHRVQGRMIMKTRAARGEACRASGVSSSTVRAEGLMAARTREPQ